MATIPEIEARIHALWATGEARTPEESAELGQLLTALEAEMPPGDFYRHVLEVLHMPARDAQPFMAQSRASQGAGSRPAPEASRGARPDKAHMATTSLTSVGSEADSPEPLLRLSPATGPDADMLEVYDPDSGYNAET